MFESLTASLSSALQSLRGRGKLTEANMREGLAQVRTALLEADVAYDVADGFLERVAADATGARVLESLDPAQQLVGIVHRELVELMGPVDHSLHLQPAEHQHRRPAGDERDRMVHRPHQADELVVDDADKLLCRVERLEHPGPGGPGGDTVEEPVGDVVGDVGLEQRRAHGLEALAHVGVGEPTAAAEARQGRRQRGG